MKKITKKIYIILKNTLLSVLFFAILYNILAFFAPLFRYDEDAISSGNLSTFYAQDEDSIDVVFVGSSALYRFISPTELYDKYGITSANYATANMSAYCMPGVIDELIDYQNPKLIVLEMRNYINNAYIEMHGGEYTEKQLLVKESMFNRLVNNMPVSINRMKVIHDTVPNMLGQDEFDWQFEYMKTHNNWKDLKLSDVKEYLIKNLSSTKEVDDFDGQYYGKDYKGTVAKDSVKYNADRDYSDYNETSEISGEWLEVLQKVVDKAKSTDTEILFLTTPYPQEKEEASYENFLIDYFEKEGVNFLSCNKKYKEIGIDFSTDFYDTAHSNISGIVKVTNYIGKYIVDEYSLSETVLTKGQKADWDKATKAYIEEVRTPGLKKIEEYVEQQKASGNKNYLD